MGSRKNAQVRCYCSSTSHFQNASKLIYHALTIFALFRPVLVQELKFARTVGVKSLREGFQHLAVNGGTPTFSKCFWLQLYHFLMPQQQQNELNWVNNQIGATRPTKLNWTIPFTHRVTIPKCTIMLNHHMRFPVPLLLNIESYFLYLIWFKISLKYKYVK